MKSFAFKLAEKKGYGDRKWTARGGIALAGCTETWNFNYRADIASWPHGPPTAPDSGYYC
jgi:hypothetical protein